MARGTPRAAAAAVGATTGPTTRTSAALDAVDRLRDRSGVGGARVGGLANASHLVALSLWLVLRWEELMLGYLRYLR